MKSVPVWIIIESAQGPEVRKAPYDFTYLPSTVHVADEDEVRFALHPHAPVPKVWVVFDKPVNEYEFSMPVKRLPPDKLPKLTIPTTPIPDGEGTTLAVSRLGPGVHHYRVVGVTEGGKELVADVYCPSIIVN
jgi:hypothetical protein